MGRSLRVLVALALGLTGCGTAASQRAATTDPATAVGGTGGSTTATAAPTPSTVETTSTTSTAPVRPERWERLPDAPITPGLGTSAAWTGRELVVVGGMPTGRVEEAGMTAAAAAYDPATNRWCTLAAGPLSPRIAKGVWAGKELLIVGGSRDGGASSL